jgi:hypothetical protein
VFFFFFFILQSTVILFFSLLNPRWIEIQELTHPLQVIGKSLDSSCIVPPFGRTLSVRLVIIGTVVVIVPFFTLLLFRALTLLTPIFNPATCISAVNDVTQISIILVSSLAVLLQWSETACRVPVRTLLVVKLMTSFFIIMVECQVDNGCYV